MRRADVAVYNPDGKLQLVVEIKNRSGASAEWVAQMRRNLLIHAVIPPSPYFLLALPDFFYLWIDAMSVHELASPDYQIKAAEVLAPYLDPSAQSLTDLSEYRSYTRKLWMRAEAAYPGDGPDHPPYEKGVDTPCKNIRQFPFHIHS